MLLLKSRTQSNKKLEGPRADFPQLSLLPVSALDVNPSFIRFVQINIPNGGRQQHDLSSGLADPANASWPR